MFKSYLKSAVRNLWVHRSYSAINIVGLSIGLASSFIIMLYAASRLVYDRFNKKLDNIYLVVTEHAVSSWKEPSAPYILGPTLKEEDPNVQEMARCAQFQSAVRYEDKEIGAANCVSSDPSIFKILTLPFISGSLRDMSTERNYAVISSEMAGKIFGSKNPLGEIVTINLRGEPYNLKISAVMQNVPTTSTLHADIFVPLFILENNLRYWGKRIGIDPLTSWKIALPHTYILLANPRLPDELESKMTSFSNSHFDSLQGYRFHLFPLKEMYLHGSGFINNNFQTVDISNMRVYPAVALLTLLIACANLVILSTGRVGVRTKEIAVRKVMGARRSDLMKQFVLESMLVSVLSLPLALLLVEIFLSTVSHLLGVRLEASDFHRLDYLLVFACIALLSGVLPGGYVSFYLSGFRPAEILTHKITSGRSKATFRMMVVGLQMMIFVGLITASITIFKQLSYFHSADMGLEKEGLLVLYPENLNLGANFETFKTELKREQSIASVTGAYNLPGTDGGNFTDVPDKSDPSRTIHCQLLSVERDFIETMKMRMISGKSFAEASQEERRNGYIINERAMSAFGISDTSRELLNGHRILGVVRDFNVRSFRESIDPIVIMCSTEYIREIGVKVRQGADLPRLMDFIERASVPFNNGKPMIHEFFDERLDNLYGKDYRFAGMIGYFTALAIFIACLGLFGVSLFLIQMRVKEIGIRKVMGASVGSIFYLLSKEFLVLTLASAVIAIPLSIHFINRWLENYAYKVSVDFWVVAFALLFAIVIVLATIAYQAIRAAMGNPVEALRYE